MPKNLRAKTVDRAHAYEVRQNGDTTLWALKYYQSEEKEHVNPWARVRVSQRNDVEDRSSMFHIDDVYGHDMYVRDFQQHPLIHNPLAAVDVESTIEVQPATRAQMQPDHTWSYPVASLADLETPTTKLPTVVYTKDWNEHESK
jgi:hypothetical protein